MIKRPTIHERRRVIHVPANFGQQASDTVASFFGSWVAVWLHVAWFIVWLGFHLDINLLTLLVSLEAIFGFIFVLMTQVRHDAKSAVRDDLEAQEVDQYAALLPVLHQINQQQLEILQRIDAREQEATHVHTEASH